jgi:DNA gyrase subunit A
MGRTSRGVRGIRLRADDHVVGMVVADPQAFLLTACAAGHGKRTPLEDYPIKGRGGQGVINIRTAGRNGDVVGISLCRDGDDVLYITQTGMIVRTPVAEISSMGRNTQGVRLVNLKTDDKLVAIEIVSETDLDRFAEVEEEQAAASPRAGLPPTSIEDEMTDEDDGDAEPEPEDQGEEDV